MFWTDFLNKPKQMSSQEAELRMNNRSYHLSTVSYMCMHVNIYGFSRIKMKVKLLMINETLPLFTPHIRNVKN